MVEISGHRTSFTLIATNLVNELPKNIRQLNIENTFTSETKKYFYNRALPDGHIFIDSPSIRRRNSTWKVCGNYIGFERRIHVEIMTSIRHGHFDVDSTFKIDEILMSSPRGFSYVGSTLNRRNFCIRCFHSIIS